MVDKCGNNDLHKVEEILEICITVLRKYSWLTQAYVLDFFVKQHWDRLLKSWTDFADASSLELLADVLDTSKSLHLKNNILPLSLNCLRILLKHLCLTRSCPVLENDDEEIPYLNKKLMNLLWRSVKSKKRHEIIQMAKLCYKAATKCSCFYIIDVGSGLGHLSRLLAYGYCFNVLSIESDGNFLEQARKLDYNFRKCALKHVSDGKMGKIAYLNSIIDHNTHGNCIKKYFRYFFDLNGDICFGVVGLHPCGDLAAILLKLYNECDSIKFINIASCCYMKLATPSSSLEDSFPLSSYCKRNNFTLDYNDREIACHAIEMYMDKLRCGEHQELKIHTYRATLEKIIVSHWPHLSHSHMNNIKYKDGLSFEEYCKNAVLKIGIDVSDKITSELVLGNLSEWHRVVKFYTLRLMFAPLIETVILLDRFLYLQENGGNNNIIAAFQPRVSPRNHILNGIK